MSDASAPATGPGEILVVDDDPVGLKALAGILGGRGYLVRPAVSGALALKSAAARAPDLILLDVRMPAMDGFEVCRRLKAEEATRDIPVLFLSASHEVPDKVRGFEAGGVDYLTKPFEEGEVLARVATHLRLRELSLRLEREVRERTRSLETSNLDLHRELAQRERLERELSESEARFRAVFERSPVGKTLTGLDGKLLVANQAFADMLGYGLDEVQGRNFADFTHPDDLAASREIMRLLLSRERETVRQEKRYLHRDGSVVWAEVSVALLRNDDASPRCFITSLIDIRERKRAEAALRESEARLKLVFENSGTTNSIFDTECRLVLQNSHSARALGAISGNAEGKTPRELFGAERGAEVEARMRRVMASRSPESFETEFQLPTGRAWYHSAYHPLLDSDGALVGLQIISQDIGERKRAEAEKVALQEQLAEARKMESIGRLAGGVAHDFNNMLGVILARAEAALESGARGRPVEAPLLEIRRAAQRSADLTRQLLAFARRQAVVRRPLDLNRVVDGMLTLLRRLVGEKAELDWKPHPGELVLLMDPGQVDQILANLCVNARDAIEGAAGGGRIILETGLSSFGGAGAPHPELPPGDYVVLRVSDNGRGMDDQVLARIFEPFFTTKGPGRGTGLGLATVYGIVKQNGGAVAAESAPGRGTRFTVHLPRQALAAEEGPSAGIEAVPARGSETLLLVEDEPMLLESLGEILEEQGFAVLRADSAESALRLAEAHPGPIHLLITDLIMPGSGGRELAQRLVAASPELHVLFMSGYDGGALEAGGKPRDGQHFIQKPFTLAELVAKVHALVGGRRDAG